MRNVFSRQLKFIDNLERDIFKVMEQTINQFNFVLVDFITNKQLFREGIDGDGKKLAGYARTTIRLKLRKGQPVDRTTTVDEGDFHASIRIKAFSDRYEITSDVEHDKFIIKRYGSNVLKITDENFREFMINYFLPNLRRYVKSKITR